MSSPSPYALHSRLGLTEPHKIFAAVIIVSLLGWITLALRSNYLRWKAIGPGGVPRNLYGWALQWLLDLTFGHHDTTFLLYFDLQLARMKGMTEEDRALAQRRFLEDLPVRSEPKARAAPFAVPQRQKIAGTGLEMLEVRIGFSFHFPPSAKLEGYMIAAERRLGTAQSIRQYRRG
jgi:hypothetical protein